MTATGEFAGKVILASDTEPEVFLGVKKFPFADADLTMPVMSAASMQEATVCVFYQTPDGTASYMQMAGLWVGLYKSNLLVLSDSVDQAAPVTLVADKDGQELRVLAGGEWRTVFYTTGASANLTINKTEAGHSIFIPHLITPSLEELRLKGAQEANLREVNFSNANLDEIDFSRADFTRAILSGSGAVGATLDYADFTGAILRDTHWPELQSAKAVNMANCIAERVTLGSRQGNLEMTGAILTGGIFDEAVMAEVDLQEAQLGAASFTDAELSKSLLNGANIEQSTFLRAKLQQASLNGVTGSGCNLIAADLSFASLMRASLGGRHYLFSLDDTFTEVLDGDHYPDQSLIKAFAVEGITLLQSAGITVVEKGRRWDINDSENGPFLAILAQDNDKIDVFRKSETAVPATLKGAVLTGANASGAQLGGADLRGVRWHSEGASLVGADLEGAFFTGAMLVGADFTTAFVSGADFSHAILANAKFRGCRISSGANNQLTGFSNAQLQGVDFSDAVILNALFTRSGISEPDGVPVFTLPISGIDKLTSESIQELASVFARYGFPIGSEASVTQQHTWLIAPAGGNDAGQGFRITKSGEQLKVVDVKTGKFLFYLNKNLISHLDSGQVDAKLRTAFSQHSYLLNIGEAVLKGVLWVVDGGDDQPIAGLVNYQNFTVVKRTEKLQVYGVMLRLSGWDTYPLGVAFNGTVALQKALNASIIGPAGLGYSKVQQNRLDWTAYLTQLPS